MYAATLFFVHMPGCDHCELDRPVVDKFEKTHPEIKVVRADLTQHDMDPIFKRFTKGEPVTPTYVLHRPGRTIDVSLGGFESVKKMEAWVRTKLEATS